MQFLANNYKDLTRLETAMQNVDIIIQSAALKHYS